MFSLKDYYLHLGAFYFNLCIACLIIDQSVPSISNPMGIPAKHGTDVNRGTGGSSSMPGTKLDVGIKPGTILYLPYCNANFYDICYISSFILILKMFLLDHSHRYHCHYRHHRSSSIIIVIFVITVIIVIVIFVRLYPNDN